MDRDKYIYYPALSASRIKSYYSSSQYVSQAALDRGVDLHRRVLEIPEKHQDIEAKCIYKSITGNGVWGDILSNSLKEHAIINDVRFDDKVVPGKAMFDIYSNYYNLGVDMKITSRTNYADFAKDMRDHYNHIQAVWFSRVAGIDPRSFIFIGIPPSVRKGLVRPNDVIFYVFPDELLLEGEQLINQYLDKQWSIVLQYLNERKEALLRS